MSLRHDATGGRSCSRRDRQPRGERLDDAPVIGSPDARPVLDAQCSEIPGRGDRGASGLRVQCWGWRGPHPSTRSPSLPRSRLPKRACEAGAPRPPPLPPRRRSRDEVVCVHGAQLAGKCIESGAPSTAAEVQPGTHGLAELASVTPPRDRLSKHAGPDARALRSVRISAIVSDDGGPAGAAPPFLRSPVGFVMYDNTEILLRRVQAAEPLASAGARSPSAGRIEQYVAHVIGADPSKRLDAQTC